MSVLSSCFYGCAYQKKKKKVVNGANTDFYIEVSLWMQMKF